MKSTVERYRIEGKGVQAKLKGVLMEALYHSAGLEEKLPNMVFKVQARNEQGSFVTVMMYESGTLLVVGHGSLFDLTHSVCSLYHRGIAPIKISRTPSRKVKARRKP
jgi:hypothetical protein